MALGASVVWECKTAGDPDNGGGFDPVSGTPGTDYTYGGSEQTLVWAAAGGDYTNDLASTSASSWLELTSASRNFVAADVGNIINILSGTNFTAGRYRIVSVAANTATLDVACGSSGDASSGAGRLGGAIDHPEDIDGVIVAGNIVYVKNGTYALTAIRNFTAGTILLPVKILGYDTARSIRPTGTNRPYVSCGASYYLSTGNYSILENFRFSGSTSYVVTPGGANFIRNCKSENTSTAAGRSAWGAGTASACHFMDVEGISYKGFAFNYTGSMKYSYCYARDSEVGFRIVSSGTEFNFNIADSCTIGFFITAAHTILRWQNNVAINCVSAIEGASFNTTSLLNNIFAYNLIGFKSTTANLHHCFDYNNWKYNDKDMVLNGTDEDNSLKGPNDTAVNPMFTSPVSTGTDGATNSSPGTTFTAASAPFTDVTTSDTLVVKAGGGATLGVYKIASVDSSTQLTLTDSPGFSLSGLTYGIAKGDDFSLLPGSGCRDAGMSMALGV